MSWLRKLIPKRVAAAAGLLWLAFAGALFVWIYTSPTEPVPMGYRGTFTVFLLIGSVFYVPVAVVVFAGISLARCIWLPERSVPVCSKCDYDLTGNVSGVCPECGTRVE